MGKVSRFYHFAVIPQLALNPVQLGLKIFPRITRSALKQISQLVLDKPQYLKVL